MRWTLISLLLALPAFATPLTGTLFQMNTEHKTPLFQWQRLEKTLGDKLDVTLIYTGMDGKQAVIETVEMEKGKLKSYKIDHKQTSQSGSLTVKDNKILFEYTRDGKSKTDEEDLPPNLFITATLTDFLADHADILLKGETLDGRMGVLDRRETVGFKFFKISESKRNGKDTVTIKMKPTSFIIAAIVDPLLLTFQKDGMKILEINGRTMPKKNVDGKWKDLDVDTIYYWK